MGAAEDLALSVGTLQACLGLSVSRATLYRRRARGSDPEVSTDRGPAARALSEDERRLMLDVLHSERFCDCAPAEVYATLLDEGVYLASASTMYRVLAAEGEVRERRSVRSRKGHPRPELKATSPNQVWSWDTTRLRGPVKWSFSRQMTPARSSGYKRMLGYLETAYIVRGFHLKAVYELAFRLYPRYDTHPAL